MRLAVVLASLAVAGSAAAAGVELLGSPAPPAVRRDLRDVDRGMPRDLRLNPDVVHARAVAASDGSVVYFASLKGGGYCAELVTPAAGPRGTVCSTAQQAYQTPISVTVPFSDPVRPDSPVTVSGRVATARARSVELVYRDQRFDYAVPTRRQHDLMRPETVTAWSADGRALANRPVAAVAFWRTRERGGG